jgi:hypothetical protein
MGRSPAPASREVTVAAPAVSAPVAARVAAATPFATTATGSDILACVLYGFLLVRIRGYVTRDGIHTVPASLLPGPSTAILPRTWRVVRRRISHGVGQQTEHLTQNARDGSNRGARHDQDDQRAPRQKRDPAVRGRDDWGRPPVELGALETELAREEAACEARICSSDNERDASATTVSSVVCNGVDHRGCQSVVRSWFRAPPPRPGAWTWRT